MCESYSAHLNRSPTITNSRFTAILINLLSDRGAVRKLSYLPGALTGILIFV